MQTLTQENREQVEIFVSCTDLTSLRTFGKGNPRAVLLEKNAQNQWIPVGRTETATGTSAPSFRTPIPAVYIFHVSQNMRLLIEDDEGSAKSEAIGIVDFEMAKLMSSANGSITLDLIDSKGKLSGKANLIASAAIRDKFSYFIDVKCKQVKDINWFSKIDPCIRFYRTRPEYSKATDPNQIPDATGWVKVYETEHKPGDLNPDFAPFRITGNKLCRGDEGAILKAELWDYSSRGESKMTRIGKGFFTIRNIMGAQSEIQTLDEKKQPTGSIIIEKFVKERSFDIIDYVNGGLNLSQMIVIDYSQANGNPKDPKSLHYFDPKTCSCYEDIITKVGQVLFQYDKDGKIPMYGFGAKMPMLGVNDSKDFFYVQKKNMPYATSIADTIKLYESAFEYCEPAGPCKLAQVVRPTMDWIKGIVTLDKYFYTVLVIITASSISDMDETVKAVVEASVLPLSIIIVGVGNARFEDAVYLDSDAARLKDSSGRTAVRDIVQFVDYKKCNSLQQLSEEVLAELPHQIVEYFTMNKIPPKGAK